jgi:hypothetical protein
MDITLQIYIDIMVNIDVLLLLIYRPYLTSSPHREKQKKEKRIHIIYIGYI